MHAGPISDSTRVVILSVIAAFFFGFGSAAQEQIYSQIKTWTWGESRPPRGVVLLTDVLFAVAFYSGAARAYRYMVARPGSRPRDSEDPPDSEE